MSRDGIRITNRRVIFMALSVWLGTQALIYMEPYGVPRFLASALVATGMVALPALLLWSWLRSNLPKTPRIQVLTLRISKETRHQALISSEIAALSAMLIFLLKQIPQ